MSCLPPELDFLLQRDGGVIFICGPKETGKTNLALLLAEISFRLKYRSEIATNIYTRSYYIKQITNYPTLEEWLTQPGRKAFILDEAGKHIKKMRFMSQQNMKIMDIIQLIRHYDALFIGCAPSETFVDSQFLNTDILDAKIRKYAKSRAKVYDYLQNTSYFINQVPKTTIEYNSKDIATFTMQRRIDDSKLSKGQQIAMYRAQHWRRKDIESALKLHPEEYEREFNKWIAETVNSQLTPNREVYKNPSDPKTTSS